MQCALVLQRECVHVCVYMCLIQVARRQCLLNYRQAHGVLMRSLMLCPVARVAESSIAAWILALVRPLAGVRA